MIIRNGTILNPGQPGIISDVYIDDRTGLIAGSDCGGKIIDAAGMFVTPGFIDTHIHGAFGTDTSDGTVEAVRNMASRLPEFGVAAFCPTTMTEGEDVIVRALEAVNSARGMQGSGDAEILGVHLEGPFMSPEMAAVQDASACVPPSKATEMLERLEKAFPGLIRIVDVAPELDGGIDFIRGNSSRYVISLAHTKADHDTAKIAFDNGAASVTHILNAMPPFGKRDPGVPGAAFDNGNIFVEIICDGIHIDPSMLRMLFRLFGPDHVIVISDSMRGAGMPDGVYKLADADVTVKNGRTYFGEHGGLGGSVTNLAQEAERLFSYGIDMDTIIRALTVNPLRRLGLHPADCGLGMIGPGMRGFVNILDNEMRLKHAVAGGKVFTQ